MIYKVNSDKSPNARFRIGESKFEYSLRPFQNGRYYTEDKEEIEYLDKQNWCKRVTDEVNSEKSTIIDKIKNAAGL